MCERMKSPPVQKPIHLTIVIDGDGRRELTKLRPGQARLKEGCVEAFRSVPFPFERSGSRWMAMMAMMMVDVRRRL